MLYLVPNTRPHTRTVPCLCANTECTENSLKIQIEYAKHSNGFCQLRCVHEFDILL